METPETIAQFLVSLAADLKTGKPVLSVLDELDEAVEEWREEFDDEETC